MIRNVPEIYLDLYMSEKREQNKESKYRNQMRREYMACEMGYDDFDSIFEKALDEYR